MTKHDASEHLVCFSCRKQFRKPSRWNSIQRERRLYPAEVKENLIKVYPCPECKNPMVNMGRCFRPPRCADKRSWEQMQLLARHGIILGSKFNISYYRSVVGSRLRPAETREAILAWPKHRTIGQRLLEKMKQQKPV